MDYAATPAAQPDAAAAAPIEEGRAPPTIDSHGGKLTPVTCFGCGPDGTTSLLMTLALLSTLAPRGVRLFGRVLDLSAARLVPGLLLTTALVMNLLPSLDPVLPVSPKFHLVPKVSTALGCALLAVSFLSLLSDALMPLKSPSRARSFTAMVAAGLAVLALPVAAGIDLDALMNDGILAFEHAMILVNYIGIPAGLAALLAWRRFDGRVFDVLLVIGTVGLLFLGGALLPSSTTGVVVFLAVALTVMAAVGAGLRGLGLAGWQGLTGRAAWVLSWILRIFAVMAIGMWTVF